MVHGVKGEYSMKQVLQGRTGVTDINGVNYQLAIVCQNVGYGHKFRWLAPKFLFSLSAQDVGIRHFAMCIKKLRLSLS